MEHNKKRVMKLGTGYLKIQLYDGDFTYIGQPMTVMIMKDGETVQTLQTDENGAIDRIALEAPDLNPYGQEVGEVPYEIYDVVIPEANGFMKITVHGVEIFDGITSVLNIHLERLAEGGPREKIINPERERAAASIGYSEAVPVWMEMPAPGTFDEISAEAMLPHGFDMTFLLLLMMLLRR